MPVISRFFSRDCRISVRVGRWLLASLLGLAMLPSGFARATGGDLAAAASGYTKLAGHVPRMAQAQFDRGRAPASLKLTGLDITLAKTAEQATDLKSFLAAVNDPHSSLYHKWLTPAQYGQRFGASDATLKLVTDWLEGSGLQVGLIPAGRGHIPFFGTKSRVELAFHTEIHLFQTAGTSHYSIVTAPSVPRALATVVKAIGGLNDFHPKPGVHIDRGVDAQVNKLAPAVTLPTTSVLGTNYLGPGDVAVIYNINPLYRQHLYGQGVTVAIAAQSDVNASILQAFWTAFGVTSSQLGLTNTQFASVAVPTNQGGSDPGETNNSDESEAYLDSEIVGAIAPGTNVTLVRDKSASVAAEFVIDNNLAGVLNISFGLCEQAAVAENSKIEALYQQAVSQGITILVATGDSGVAGCDDATGVGVKGYAVNGLASTPYNIAVGGTEFDLNQLSSQNWSGAALPTLTTAQSYIAETVWNESCASPTLATFFGMDPVTLCNTATLNGSANSFVLNFGGGGGLSSCVTEDSTTNVCNGGYPQPAWQAGVPGITSFGSRGLPDIAMAATHWISCDQNTPTCDPTTLGDFEIEYGTSAATPAAAAIVAILDQSQISASSPDGRQGLLADRLYSIAAAQWSSAATLAGCNSSQGTNVATNCVFYDITTGNSDQPCQLSTYQSSDSLPASTCVGDAGGYGLMEQGSTPDYPAASGYDLATGLGSLNASNLVTAFNALVAPSGLAAHASGTTVALTWNGDTVATSFNVYEGATAGAESSTPAQTGLLGSTASITGFTNGQTYYFTLSAVTPYGTSASSNETSVTIVPAAPTGLVATVANNIVTLTWTGGTGAATYNLYQGSSSGAEATSPVQSNLTGGKATVSGLTAGHTYYFTVAGVDSGGDSSMSAEASAAIPAPSSGGGGAFGWIGVGALLSRLVIRFTFEGRRRGVTSSLP